jgi:hypothetical protein
MSDTENKSSIPELEIPDFHPTIPEPMLENIKNDQTKYMMEQMSIIKQNTEWSSVRLRDIYSYTRTMNGKIIELEEFRMSQQNDQKILDAVEKVKKHINKSKKWHYRIALMVFLLILYPLFLAQWDPAKGITDLFKLIF